MTDNSAQKPLPGELLGAVRRQHAAEVKDLLQRGADVNEGADGQCALMCAVARGYTEIARLLVEKGADVNKKTPRGVTPLMEAASTSYLASCMLLLENGAEINAADNNGWTALMEAVLGENADETVCLEIVRLLLDKGADMNMRNNGDATAQDIAEHYELREITQLLKGTVELQRLRAEAEAAQTAHDLAAERQQRLQGRTFKVPIIRAPQP